MTYASATRRLDPVAILGALGVPSALGVLMVFGLAVSVAKVPPGPQVIGETITETRLTPPPPPEPEPEPDPKPKPEADSAPPRETPVDAPAPPRPVLPPAAFKTGRIAAVAQPGTGSGEPSGTGTGSGDAFVSAPAPPPQRFDPVGAQPRNDPLRWVTNEDYRPRWILEQMAGTARFTLAIDTTGRVTDCKLNRSTGHPPLDTATCELVKQRARFEAARDETGKPVAGSYTGSVTWKIP
ncbi:MAG: energy transducer TonB [Erythrobacter sp.]